MTSLKRPIYFSYPSLAPICVQKEKPKGNALPRFPWTFFALLKGGSHRAVIQRLFYPLSFDLVQKLRQFLR